MKRPPKYDVSEAIAPPPRTVRVPPVAGRASVPTRVGSWDSRRGGEREEPRGGIGAHAEPRERAGIGGGERGQGLRAPASLECGEHEELVGDDRAAHAATQLVLRGTLAEGRC